MQKSRPTQNKRARERARQEKQQQKAARRLQSKSQRPATQGGDGEDPDIAGIVPGPQPSPWGEDEDVRTAVDDVVRVPDGERNRVCLGVRFFELLRPGGSPQRSISTRASCIIRQE